MELNRKSFQGVMNIVRFNWHFYLIALVLLLAAPFFKYLLPIELHLYATIGLAIGLATVLSSLLVSYYIYDVSKLYQMGWLHNVSYNDSLKLLNVNAGFDETSHYISNTFPDIELTVCDFYDPTKHTEVSIERARKLYPSYPDTLLITTDSLPFTDNEFDVINVFMSAHEIRDEKDRFRFFKELNRVVTPDGKIVVTEHLRDLNNFLAFTFGFFHFYSRASWLNTFHLANLDIIKEIKTTPFITTYIIRKNGITN